MPRSCPARCCPCGPLHGDSKPKFFTTIRGSVIQLIISELSFNTLQALSISSLKCIWKWVVEFPPAPHICWELYILAANNPSHGSRQVSVLWSSVSHKSTRKDFKLDLLPCPVGHVRASSGHHDTRLTRLTKSQWSLSKLEALGMVVHRNCFLHCPSGLQASDVKVLFKIVDRSSGHQKISCLNLKMAYIQKCILRDFARRAFTPFAWW